MAAIKRLNPKSYQSEHEFKKDLRIISSFHHQNISRFIGYCDEANERIIVHEHGVNGSVANYLENQSNKLPKLTWAQRLKICLGAARGLQYLHLVIGEDSQATRGNINSKNILLDETMEAKISFFGFPRDWYTLNEPHLYLSDMYSFGVIMFEILSGHPVKDLNRYVHLEDQFDQFQEYYRGNKLKRFIDDYIRDQIDSPSLNILIDVAYRCIKRRSHRHIMMNMHLHGRGWERGKGTRYIPRSDMSFTMNEVVEMIEDAMDLEGDES